MGPLTFPFVLMSPLECEMEKLQQLQMDKWPANTVCIPETSRSALLLFLQKDGCETG